MYTVKHINSSLWKWDELEIGQCCVDNQDKSWNGDKMTCFLRPSNALQMFFQRVPLECKSGS